MKVSPFSVTFLAEGISTVGCPSHRLRDSMVREEGARGVCRGVRSLAFDLPSDYDAGEGREGAVGRGR